MNHTKKIIVNKNDEPTLIAEKLIDIDADSVILSIPRFSRFGESLSNFKLIKRESEVLEKEVAIESVDDEVLAHAQEAGIVARNPFLEERRRRVSDIMMHDDLSDEKTPPEHSKAAPVQIRVSHSKAHEEQELRDDEEGSESDEEETEEEVVVGPSMDYQEEASEEEAGQEAPEQEVAIASSRHWGKGEPVRPKAPAARGVKRRVAMAGMAVAAILLVYAAVRVLPRAEATIVTEKESWSFNQNIKVDNTLSEVDSATLTIPGQVFIKRDAATMKFPATGKQFVERKAKGILTIYNADSSQKQPLVVNTRFQTPDGKIFRLTSGVEVPGAKVQAGKISPSNIDVEVVADKAGADYNIGAISKLTIPGFADSEKFNTFYGELKQGTSGGFVGETQVPTEQDLSNAKKQSASSIESSLRRQLGEQIPAEFVVLDGATKFTIFKQAVDASVDAQNNFTILTEAQVGVLAFRQEDVDKVIAHALATEKSADYIIWENTLNYGNLQLQNPAGGAMSLPIDYQATISKEIDITSLQGEMRDKSEEELRTIIVGVPGVANARISLWPFWVRSVPQNEDRIKIIVE